MNEKLQEILVAVALIAALVAFMVWNLWSELETKSEQEQFGQIIESTWNQEFDNEGRVLIAPKFE